ncbi:MAG: GxxExxY protein [Phycisphaerae bacterium]|nr:GxxExxY protein [Phycisphaerae bacterium]
MTDDYSGGYRGSNRGRGGYGGPPRERRGIPLSDLDPALTDTSRKVIGSAIEVHKALGPGFDESVYANALKRELEVNGVTFVADHKIPVKFRDQAVGQSVADLFVGDKFLVEVMARPGEVTGYDRAAVRAQLKAANLDLALIINFAERRLKDGLVRVLNIEKINADRGVAPGEGDYDDHAEGGHQGAEGQHHEFDQH